jgi:hypothetical protein
MNGATNAAPATACPVVCRRVPVVRRPVPAGRGGEPVVTATAPYPFTAKPCCFA